MFTLVQGQEDKTTASEESTSETKVWNHHAMHNRNMWLGGVFLFGSESIKDGASSTQFSLGPQWGMMINNRMGFGVNLLYTNNSDKVNDNNNTKETVNTWEVLPYFRWYFAGIKRFKVYGDAYVGFGSSSYKSTSDSQILEGTKNTSDFKIGIAPGVQYWFADDFSFATSVGILEYGNYKDNKNSDGVYTSEETSKSNFDIGIDFTRINFALFYHF